MTLIELRKEYDKLQKIYGAKELASIDMYDLYRLCNYVIYIAVSKENRYNRVVERDKNFFE